jgi:hypothetical protein
MSQRDLDDVINAFEKVWENRHELQSAIDTVPDVEGSFKQEDSYSSSAKV